MLRVWLLATYAMLAVEMVIGTAVAVWSAPSSRTPGDIRTALVRLARLCQCGSALVGLALACWQLVHV